MSNNHPDISKINKHMGLPLTAAYCSSSGIYTAYQAGMKFTSVNGRAYSWKHADKLVFYPAMLKGNKRRQPEIKEMDAVVFNMSHVEFAAKNPKNGEIFSKEGIYTIGCNTRGGLKRIEGCYYPIFRPWSLVYAAYNHVGPWYTKNSLTLK